MTASTRQLETERRSPDLGLRRALEILLKGLAIIVLIALYAGIVYVGGWLVATVVTVGLLIVGGPGLRHTSWSRRRRETWALQLANQIAVNLRETLPHSDISQESVQRAVWLAVARVDPSIQTGDASLIAGPALMNAQVRQIGLQGGLKDADLRGSNFEGFDLRAVDLSRANLYTAVLARAELVGANLEGADLRQANLQRTNLAYAKLKGADLQGANLEGADLRGANLQQAKLGASRLRGARLWNADLHGADLYKADLQEAEFQGALLQGAILRHANSRGADFHAADLRGARASERDLEHANLTEAFMSAELIGGSRAELIEFIRQSMGLSEAAATKLLDPVGESPPFQIDGQEHGEAQPLDIELSLTAPGSSIREAKPAESSRPRRTRTARKTKAVLETAQSQNITLRDAMAAVQDALAAPDQLPSEDWAQELAGTAEQLARTFRGDEPNGLYDQALADDPRLIGKVKRFRTEHISLGEALDASVARARSVTDKNPTELTKLREEMLSLLARLNRHQARAADLLYEAYGFDIGGGD